PVSEISTHLEQAFEVVAFELRAERVAEAAANLFQDLAGALHVDLVRHLHGIAEIGSRRGAGASQRVAVGALPAAAFLAAAVLALHGLHHLLHHVLRAAPQRFQRLALLADRAFALALAERAFGAAHRLAR